MFVKHNQGGMGEWLLTQIIYPYQAAGISPVINVSFVLESEMDYELVMSNAHVGATNGIVDIIKEVSETCVLMVHMKFIPIRWCCVHETLSMREELYERKE